MEDPSNFTYDKYEIMNSHDDQYQTSLDELLNFQSFPSHENYTSTSPTRVPEINQTLIHNSLPTKSPVVERPVSKKRSNSSSSSCPTQLISFESSNVLAPHVEAAGPDGYLIFHSSRDGTQTRAQNSQDAVAIGTRVGSIRRPSSHSQEHVVAERKRREKLTQRFIALSAVIPGLQKLDKASVLGGAIKYVKELEERVKTLEDQALKKTIESVVFAKRLSSNDQLISTVASPDHDHEIDVYSYSDQPLPEIEARVSNKEVLIRIHCEKRKGSNLANILGEIEKLHLTVVNSSVMPLGSFTIDITVIAQMDVGFCMDVKHLKENLREIFLKHCF